MRHCRKSRWLTAAAAWALIPGVGQAQSRAAPPSVPAPVQADQQPPAEPIVPDAEFEAAMPRIDSDINAPLDPLTSVDALPSTQPRDPAVTPIPAEELARPLTPLDQFRVEPVQIGRVDSDTTTIRYQLEITGLDGVGLTDRFNELSALRNGDGKAANAAQVAARATEDEKLAIRLLQSIGYYDATAVAAVETLPDNPGQVRATVTAVPGERYTIGSIAFDAPPTVPPGLIADNFGLRVGDPIDAVRVQAAEASVSLVLPQNGYAFAQVGQRDILLDEKAFTGAYTLPVDTGPRSSFGGFRSEGDAVFGTEHIGVLARFDRGELYDSRRVDDLRKALVATGLFSTVTVEPQRTGRPGPDGTEQVDLLVRQNAGPPRTLAIEGGYGTGQGLRVEGSWTHRNLFPPEGALILSGVAGTQEQGVSATFRRSNAGRRDRAFSIIASAARNDFEAYDGITGTLAARIAYDSTPIWQKKFTYAYGIELVGTREARWDFGRNARVRDTYFIAAIPLEGTFDQSDDLLNPTKGYRIKLNLSPETAVRGATRPYARAMIEGTAYYPVTDSLVIAGRARFATIQGIERDNIAPSRRLYAGGGGSVRGYGYQDLGPRSPDGRPLGGRSLNEFSIEARYRFGNFGIVPFVDAGQVYEGTVPRLSRMRFGAGIGGRFYTNFGPLRLDVATPIGRREGEPVVAVYISIGQAF